jgi:hypothetical protein
VVATPAVLDLKAATPLVAGRVRLAARLSWVTGALAVLVAAAGRFWRQTTGRCGKSSAMLNRGHRTTRKRLSRHGNDQR